MESLMGPGILKICVLPSADTVAEYALWMMQIYLTNVWKMRFTNAATIVNIFQGVSTILPLGLIFIINTISGGYWMLVFSSLSCSVGLGFLAMSTPPVLSKATGTCSEYEPACIGQTQIILYYTSLALIAFGISGHCASLKQFMKDQMPSEEAEGHIEESPNKSSCYFFIVFQSLVFIPAIFVFAVAYIKPWSIRFGIPAIYSLLATLFFLTGSPSYVRVKPRRSPLPCVFASELTIRMVPVCITVILCGVVLGIWNTFFLEQANHMNDMLGHLKFPITLFLYWYTSLRSLATYFYSKISNLLGETRKVYAAPVGIATGMLLSIFCCITAAKVEERRMDVIKGHGLLDKPYDKIPMTIFWLVPQLILLGTFDGLAREGVRRFFCSQVSASMREYMSFFTEAVFGAGIIGSVLFVCVSSKVSEQGGRPGWFQYTLNQSRLDYYYWTLAILSGINLVFFVVIACFYSYEDFEIEDEEPPLEVVEVHQATITSEPYDDDSPNCCCCFIFKVHETVVIG